MTIKKIAILTGGGDCPGLNAAVRAIAKTCIHDYGWNVVGILDGYEGLVTGHMREVSYDAVSNILFLGGTVLGTSNKANPFKFYEDGKEPADLSDTAVKNLKKWDVDVLFCIGGDGTLSIAHRMLEKWPRIIGVPKTIDNDLSATDQTFGFDSACAFATMAIDRIHSTAVSHHRAMVIEVMGRYAGWIALESGLAGGGDIILIPEFPFNFDKIIEVIGSRSKAGKRASIVVVAEGAHPAGEDYTVNGIVKDSPDPIRLGGIGKRVADHIEKHTGHEPRVTVLGHLQRGGSPTFYDRVLATRYGHKAAALAREENFGKMAALKGNEIVGVDISEATSELKLVTADNSLVAVAKSLGTSFGIC